MKHSALIWIFSVLAMMLLLGWLGSRTIQQSPSIIKSQGNPLIGGHFELVDGQNKPVTEKNFAGNYMLVYFGYTHCPDICPTALLVMQNALNELGSDASKIVPIFITVDPERDTPKVMGDYVAHFGANMVGLSGNPAQIKQVADAYKVYYAKIEAKDSALGYMMDHSGFIYLMGPDGKYITHFPYNITEQQLKDALAKNLR